MRAFLIPTFIATFLVWAFFAFVVLAIPPKIEGNLVISNFVYFILSGGLAFGLTLSLALFFLTRYFRPKVRTVDTSNIERQLFVSALRRGLLVSVFVSVVVALKISGLLSILNVVLLFGTLVLTELYFRNR